MFSFEFEEVTSLGLQDSELIKLLNQRYPNGDIVAVQMKTRSSLPQYFDHSSVLNSMLNNSSILKCLAAHGIEQCEPAIENDQITYHSDGLWPSQCVSEKIILRWKLFQYCSCNR